MDPLVAAQELLGRLEPTGIMNWSAAYSLVELPFDGAVLAALEAHADGHDWDVSEIEARADWREDLAGLAVGPMPTPAFRGRAQEVLRALDELLGEAPEVWSIEMEERVREPWDTRFFEAVAEEDFERMKQLLDESDEFARRHPRRPGWSADYVFRAGDRLFLLECAFEA